MSTRRTRVAMSTGGKPPAAQHKQAAAAVKKEAPKATRATTRHSTRRTPKTPKVVEDEAEEVEEELENSSDKELETEERLGQSTSDVKHDRVGSTQSSNRSVLVLTSDEDEDTPKRPDIEITPKRGKKMDTKGKNKTQPGGKHATRDPSDEEKSDASAPFKLPAREFTTPKKASKPPNLHETFWTSTPSSNTKLVTATAIIYSSNSSSRMLSFVHVQKLKGPCRANEDDSQAGSNNDVTGSKGYVDLPLNKKGQVQLGEPEQYS
ncbi:hypothetical protein C8Q80DRAFT_1123401 [Daedaleopsis nitida]|nr:hypothetical protein C8Q80DRAFT_1123401 [Daedaleopsis nitida]